MTGCGCLCFCEFACMKCALRLFWFRFRKHHVSMPFTQSKIFVSFHCCSFWFNIVNWINWQPINFYRKIFCSSFTCYLIFTFANANLCIVSCSTHSRISICIFGHARFCSGSTNDCSIPKTKIQMFDEMRSRRIGSLHVCHAIYIYWCYTQWSWSCAENIW